MGNSPQTHKQLNLEMLKHMRSLGVHWHHTTWLASAHSFGWMPESITALYYEVSRDLPMDYIDPVLVDSCEQASSRESLLMKLDGAGLHGWITLAKLNNRIFLENGEQQQGGTTLDFWFYGESPEALYNKVNAWAHGQIKKMKQQDPVGHAQGVINSVMEVN